MGIEVISRFIGKATVLTIAYVYDKERVNLVDPSGSIKVTITDPDGTKVADAEDMVKVSTGIYEHYLRTTTSYVKGWYPVEVLVVDGSGALAITSIATTSFEII